jgi:hypothetical protein
LRRHGVGGRAEDEGEGDIGAVVWVRAAMREQGEQVDEGGKKRLRRKSQRRTIHLGFSYKAQRKGDIVTKTLLTCKGS